MTEGERERRTSVPKQLQLFGEYVIDKPLEDEGPTWTSYSAVHVQRTDERFIVRVLRGVNATRRNVIEAFARQAYILESLKHAGIVPIAAAGVDQGLVFIIKPDVRGVTLADKLRGGDDALTGPEVARHIKEAASVLDYLHRQTPPVVHRDLDPSKILIADVDQKVRVLEVGYVQALEEVARVEPLETPWHRTEEAYRAPEDLPGAVINGAADQYSLAIIAQRCLAHCGPMSSVLKTATQHVFTRALDAKVTARFPTTGAFATALELAITAALRTASRQASGGSGSRPAVSPPGASSHPASAGALVPKPASPTSTASFAAVPASAAGGAFAIKPPSPNSTASFAAMPPATVASPGVTKTVTALSGSNFAAVPRPPAHTAPVANEATVTRRKNTLVGTAPEVVPLLPMEPDPEPTRGRTVPPAQGDTNKWVALGADGKPGSTAPQPIGPASEPHAIAIDSALALAALKTPPLPRTAGVSAAVDLGADDLFGAIGPRERPSVAPPSSAGPTLKPTEDSGESLSIDLDEVVSSPPPPPRSSVPPPGSTTRPAVAPADWRPPEPPASALATPAVHEITDETPPPMAAVVVPMMPSVPETISASDVTPGPVSAAPSERPPPAAPFASVPARTSSRSSAPSYDSSPSPRPASSGRTAWILAGAIVLASLIYVGGVMLRPVLEQLVVARTATPRVVATPSPTPTPTLPQVAPPVPVVTADVSTVAAVVPSTEPTPPMAPTVAMPDAGTPVVIAAVHAVPPTTPDVQPTVAPVPPAGHAGPLPRHPNNRARHEVQDQIAAHIEQCPGHVGHHARMHVTYSGPTGAVTAVEFSGSTFTGTPMGACIEQAVRAIPVAPFSEPEWRTDYSVLVH